tara:strand:- start:467 stop:652 length:186 start_codon:yes stop_codon:yes gene_type:complete
MHRERVERYLELLNERYALKIEQINKELDKKRPNYNKIKEWQAAEYEILLMRKAHTDILDN